MSHTVDPHATQSTYPSHLPGNPSNRLDGPLSDAEEEALENGHFVMQLFESEATRFFESKTI